MQYSRQRANARNQPTWIAFVLLALCVLLAGCGGGNTSGGTSKQLASKQVLIFPDVGIRDPSQLDPSQGPDSNSAQVVSMIFSGLVRADKNLQVLPNQATWQISNGGKTYTFTIDPNVKFSNGTPVTAQDYVYTWTRALLPQVGSSIAAFFEGNIVGASAVNSGKVKTLAGVKALSAHTLQVTLTRPTPYFLEELTTSLFDPLNHTLVDKYGQKNWTQHISAGAGTGPFMVKSWDHNVKMTFVPNPYYYGPKTKLTEVDMPFVVDPSTAYKAFSASQYSLIWKLTPQDQQKAQAQSGFTRQSLLQSDLLFFDNTKAPFNNLAVRQAFAYAIDKATLAHAIFKDAVTPAQTIIPPGMPGYQPNYPGIPYNRAKAKQLFTSVYPNASKVPPITFTYPNSQITPDEAAALQQMWQEALGVQVKMNAMDLATYNALTAKFEVPFGFTQWGADFPDPYDWLTLNLLSTAPNNDGQWHNAQFDHLCALAETQSGNTRIQTYNQAEQIAISDVGWLPLDHQAMAAVIPSWMHGVTLNGNGLYFGDWSNVYLLQH
jgi:ABC-type oligopeptide transport system substrate-binding subunit